MRNNGNSWCIYKITNKENGKAYIGITKKLFTRRWNEHAKKSHNKELRKDLSEYGFETFSWEVLDTGLKEGEAKRIEKETIHSHMEDGVSLYNIQHTLFVPTPTPTITKKDKNRHERKLNNFCREVDYNLRRLHLTYFEYLEEYIVCEFKFVPPMDEVSFMRRKEESLLYLKEHNII
jgi:group I intron endonuclease